MHLKNYTTTIPAYKTIAEIERLLSDAGATSVSKTYDMNKNVSSLRFGIKINDKIIEFKLPCEFEKINERLKNLKNTGKIKSVSWKQLKTPTHSYNVGWRLLKDWIEIQVSLIYIEQVKLHQVFLPYMYSAAQDRTLFEKMEETDFNLLLEAQS